MDSGFGSLSSGRGREQPLRARIDPCARPFAADALQGDTRPLDQQEELVGKLLRLGVARSAHQRYEPLALPALVRLDHAPCRMARFSELDRRVGKGAAAAAAL